MRCQIPGALAPSQWRGRTGHRSVGRALERRAVRRVHRTRGDPQDAACGAAHLAGVPEGGVRDCIGGLIQVGISEDDHRSVSAEFEEQVLVRTGRSNALTRGASACEANRADDGVHGQVSRRVQIVGQNELMRSCGKSASRSTARKRAAIRDVDGAGFQTTAFPVEIAGPMYSIGIFSGKFHGVTTAQTPRGSRLTITRFVGSATRGAAPESAKATVAATRNPFAADRTSASASKRGFPCSRVSSAASSCSCASIAVDAAKHQRARSSGSRSGACRTRCRQRLRPRPHPQSKQHLPERSRCLARDR